MQDNFWELAKSSEVEMPDDIDLLLWEGEIEAMRTPESMCGKGVVVQDGTIVVTRCHRFRTCPTCMEERVELWLSRLKMAMAVAPGDWCVAVLDEKPDLHEESFFFPIENSFLVISDKIEGDPVPDDEDDQRMLMRAAVMQPEGRRPSATKDLTKLWRKPVSNRPKSLGFVVDISIDAIAKVIQRLEGFTTEAGKDRIDFVGVTQERLLTELVKLGHTVRLLGDSCILTIEGIATKLWELSQRRELDRQKRATEKVSRVDSQPLPAA